MTAPHERGPAAGPTIGPITCVTFTAPDLDAVRECYGAYLDYRVVEDGEIDVELANRWQAPAVAGRRYLLLAPAAAEDCFFRAIEGPANPDYLPFSTYGWNAAELMVENVDAMAERLHDSPFQIVGEPQDLSFSDDIRAMQILGPGKELLYLTQFKREVPGLSVPMPRFDKVRIGRWLRQPTCLRENLPSMNWRRLPKWIHLSSAYDTWRRAGSEPPPCGASASSMSARSPSW